MSTTLFTAAAALHPAADGYALAYGSHATRPRPTSDLDLLYTGTAHLPAQRLARLIDGVKQLHGDHGLILDEEVSFTSKLYATPPPARSSKRPTSEASTAPRLRHARRQPRGPELAPVQAAAPPQRVDDPHVLLAGDVHTYRRHAAAAERGAALLALRISGALKITFAAAASALMSSEEGLTESRFLGYRRETHLHALPRGPPTSPTKTWSASTTTPSP
ncbi:hypothetical protein [Streptomyces sp. NPDC056013]|uniref:hypothetical protein n=1 Tax=Streptomyces sp. NPDC056013 TaxID=3345680 RepID=UPI0035D930F0